MNHFKIGPLEVSRVEETRTIFDATMFYPDLSKDTPGLHASWLAPYFDIAAHSFSCVFQSFVIRHACDGSHVDNVARSSRAHSGKGRLDQLERADQIHGKIS